MLLFTVVVALVVSASAIAYVVWPMLAQGQRYIAVEDDRLTELIARKDATLLAIKELEFDYQTDKLSKEDYERMEDRLRRQAIGYIKAIEKLAPESAQMDEKIEAEISAFRKTAVPVARANALPAYAAQTQQAPVDALVAEAVPAGLDETGDAPEQRFCTNCGNPLMPEHKFCGRCGAPVT